MNTEQWIAFCDMIQVCPTGQLSLLPKPTDAQLNQFEDTAGVKLPASYREFAKRFGPGELAHTYMIFVPSSPLAREDEDPILELQQFNEVTKASFDMVFLERYPDTEQVLRLIFFCEAHGEYIGWDPEDVRSTSGHEYGIYELGRRGALRLLAESFSDFVKEVCCSPPAGWPQDPVAYQVFDPVADWR